MCVQRFDDSLNSAIHITYRISLRSSSMPEPRDPLLKVFCYCVSTQTSRFTRVWVDSDGRSPAGADGGGDPAGPPKQRRYGSQRVGGSGPGGPSLGNDPSAGSPTERRFPAGDGGDRSYLNQRAVATLATVA